MVAASLLWHPSGTAVPNLVTESWCEHCFSHPFHRPSAIEISRDYLPIQPSCKGFFENLQDKGVIKHLEFTSGFTPLDAEHKIAQFLNLSKLGAVIWIRTFNSMDDWEPATKMFLDQDLLEKSLSKPTGRVFNNTSQLTGNDLLSDLEPDHYYKVYDVRNVTTELANRPSPVYFQPGHHYDHQGGLRDGLRSPDKDSIERLAFAICNHRAHYEEPRFLWYQQGFMRDALSNHLNGYGALPHVDEVGDTWGDASSTSSEEEIPYLPADYTRELDSFVESLGGASLFTGATSRDSFQSLVQSNVLLLRRHLDMHP